MEKLQDRQQDMEEVFQRFLESVKADGLTRALDNVGDPDKAIIRQVFEPRDSDDPVAVDLTVVQALVNVTWTPEHKHIEFLDNIKHTAVLRNVFMFYLRKTLASHEEVKLQSIFTIKLLFSWLQNVFCRVADSISVYALRRGCIPAGWSAEEEFTQLCKVTSCPELAVLVLALMCNWNRVNELMSNTALFSNRQFLSKLFWFCFKLDASHVVLQTMLQRHFRVDVFPLDLDTSSFQSVQLVHLADIYEEQSLLKWQAFFLVKAKELDRLLQLIVRTKTGHPEVCNMALWVSAADGNVDFVKRIYPACTDVQLLMKVQEMLTSHCICLDLVDHLYLHQLFHSDQKELCSLVEVSVRLPPGKDVAFARTCLQYGLSTFYLRGSDLCEEAITRLRPKVLRLFLKSGVVNYQQYYDTLRKPHIQTILRANPHLHGEIEANIPELQAGAMPTLQNLCVLKTSCLIGFGPNRQQSIEHLQMSDSLKKALRFQDIN